MDRPRDRVFVACPDARAPGYQAAAGLAKNRLLDRFLTAYYHKPGALGRVLERIARNAAPKTSARLERRRTRVVPDEKVLSAPSYDLAIALENRLARVSSSGQRAVAKARTRSFDRKLARVLARHRPGALLTFSDVGSEHALAHCRELGIPAAVSMVCGDPREEIEILRKERELAGEFFPIYLGGAALDLVELDWLHERRRQDARLADALIVPSEHIAAGMITSGVPECRIAVIPYAADVHKFKPKPAKTFRDNNCTFVFAGGVCQRKGIKYLLEAWQQVRGPGRALKMIGALPVDTKPLAPFRDSVEWVGRVGGDDMAALLAEADVFVFPSLFEGSAVVTYEALAAGLPAIVTPNAGSVVRDGMEGRVTPIRDVDRLARAMDELAANAALREQMALAARARALEFTWQRYHQSVTETMIRLLEPRVAVSARAFETAGHTASV